MGEIIHVQIGECGNIMGKRFLNTVRLEHNLDKQGYYDGKDPNNDLQRINLYFREKEIQNRVKYVPRAIIIDCNYERLRETLMECFRQFIDEDNVENCKIDTNNNWAKGYHGAGCDVKCSILNTMRKEAEACESMEGIQIVHGLSGGTGGGLTSLLAERLTEEYPKKILQSYSLLPPRLDMNTPQLYNTVLTLTYLDKYVHEIFCMDHDTIRRIHVKNKGKNDEYDWISSLMSGITSCVRFPCSLNMNLRALLVKMQVYPHLHFYVPGYVEKNPEEMRQKKSSEAISSLTQRVFDDQNIFLNCHLAEEYFLTATAICRGLVSPTHLEERMLQVRTEYHNNFLEWLPDSYAQTTVCSVLPCYCRKWSLTTLLNTTAIHQPFQILLDNFKDNVRKKNQLEWYTKANMEISEFTDAEKHLDSLLRSIKTFSTGERKAKRKK